MLYEVITMTADEAKNYGIIDTVIQIDRKQTE